MSGNALSDRREKERKDPDGPIAIEYMEGIRDGGP
jgi:hypothetical protein